MPDARAADPLRLELRRTIAAPRERVFRAWTMGTSVQQWFSTVEAPVKKVKIEPRVGGAFVIECNYQGGTWRLDGEIRELIAPQRLAFTWVTSDVPAAVGSLVTVDFHDRDGATEVVLVQTGFPAEQKRSENENGWQELMGHMGAMIASQPSLRSVARRVIPAPPDAVWRAWTSPEMMKQFLSPSSANASVTVDLRVGGRFSILMAGDNGKTWPHSGEYLEIDPPRRLKFTWWSDWSPPDLHPTVTVDLAPVEGGTEVVLVHESQNDEPTRADHEQGWADFLDMLIVFAKAGFAAASLARAAQAMKDAKGA